MKNQKTIKVLSFLLAAGMLLSFSACGKKNTDASETEETDDSGVESVIETVPTVTEATTSLPDYSGPLPSSDIAMTWSENQIEQTVKYATVSEGEFLRVRKGPGTDYEIVGTLTRNQQVVVVAISSSGWYKTSDGFYVSSTYLADAPAS